MNPPFSPEFREKFKLGVRIVFGLSILLTVIFRVLMAQTGAPAYEYLTGMAVGLLLLAGSGWFWLAAVSPPPGSTQINVMALVFNFVFAFLLLAAGVWIITRGIMEFLGR